MEFNKTNILKTMKNEAIGAFGDGWEQIKQYAPAEFEKMAIQLVTISKNVALYKIDRSKGFSVATGKALLTMQRTAMESVFVAMSALVLMTIQNAINAIFKVLKATFSAALQAIL